LPHIFIFYVAKTRNYLQFNKETLFQSIGHRKFPATISHQSPECWRILKIASLGGYSGPSWPPILVYRDRF